ncbi:MAG: hypothetical protein ACRCUZ_03065, partial [Shewanella sp.]
SCHDLSCVHFCRTTNVTDESGDFPLLLLHLTQVVSLFYGDLWFSLCLNAASQRFAGAIYGFVL